MKIKLNRQANKCLLKIAEYAAINEDYSKAIRLFEEVNCKIERYN